MTQELGQIRETRGELKGLRRLVEALTGMVEGLVANQRVQIGGPEQEATLSPLPRSPPACVVPSGSDQNQALD